MMWQVCLSGEQARLVGPSDDGEEADGNRETVSRPSFCRLNEGGALTALGMEPFIGLHLGFP